ncbi:MAG: lipid A biosynthesis lauroyl acyltransferase [Helicobacter sp.]|nr:lipid A biosynthesis lauroyl acyltransferase [Helicobacter sp.]
MKQKIMSFLFFSLARFVAALPHWAFLGFLKTLAWLFALLDRRRKRDARVNLDFVYGDRLSNSEKERIIARCYQNFAFNILESLRIAVDSKEAILRRVNFVGQESAENAIPKGKPFVIITAHYGCWELAAVSAGIMYGRVGNVGRMFKNKTLDMFLRNVRERFGIVLIDKQNGLKAMLKMMSKGTALGMIVDQNTSESEGRLVQFFGKQVRHTPAPAILARRFETAILPVFVQCNADFSHCTAYFCTPILPMQNEDVQEDILQMTQQIADITQEMIEQKPEEWFWFHKRFKNQYEEIYG